MKRKSGVAPTDSGAETPSQKQVVASKIASALKQIAPYISSDTNRYRTAHWLLSDFDSPIWKYQFCSKKPQYLNWAVSLDDGSLLTDAKNRVLHESFKTWLILSTRNAENFHSESTTLENQSNCFRSACNLIDELLINSANYNLMESGLAGITSGEFKELLNRLAADSWVSESLYCWSANLAVFCSNQVKRYSAVELHEAVEKHPYLLDNLAPDDEDPRKLLLEPNEVLNVRAALVLGGYYTRSRAGGWAPDTVKISQEIYRNTLTGHLFFKPTPQILKVTPGVDAFLREHPSVPVKSRLPKRMDMGQWNRFRHLICLLGRLRSVGLPSPQDEYLDELLKFSPPASKKGRFKTVPSGIVFKQMEQAIVFHLEYGKALVDSYSSVAIYCLRHKRTTQSLSKSEIIQLIDKKIAKLGVKKISLNANSNNREKDVQLRNVKGLKKDYYTALRNNEGLIDLLCVYFGAVEIVVGVLSGRRSGELRDLPVEGCLDITKEWLIFKGEKGSYSEFGGRSLEARPMEGIGADMIDQLCRLKMILFETGVISSPGWLFASPNTRGDLGDTDVDSVTYDRNLDLFCDYFETPLDKKGRRYYPRQHQYRRFFALLFFFSASFGGLETLQWMLGHKSMQHVWNYISNANSGEILRSAKAQFVAEFMHNENHADFAELAELVKHQFGTTDVTLADVEELESYIDSLLKSGQVDIDPVFLNTPTGERMRLIVHIKDKSNER
ncbi:hypothetical protein [Pseudomonas graminis]|uniref:hypothetical protein n=1 Tax=Pseudomonas graminis TaxID=158627 RepID=UPI0009F3AF68|nr:hypothetical protein [Pseudomonas graminis]